jgi:pimeloyl-ACP methyl ester carboxylesterase
MRGRDRQTWFAFAERAAAEGYRVLAFDFRGYGTSSGAADTGLDTDIAAAVGALRGEGASQVIVMGASMGGTAAVNAGTQLDLAGVVALSAPGNFLGLEALDVAVNVTEPLLAVAGELDQPYADAIVGIGESAPNGQSILLETSQHGTNLFVSHDTELTNLLLAFARDNFA